ncbi:MAG: demethoxyubiquinone hydroxylase family protein [Hydrogenophaga sp.]
MHPAPPVLLQPLHATLTDPPLDTTPVALPSRAVADLRTDHAGETGAVCIYQGVLRFSRDPALRAFAARHLETERAHLQQIEAWLPIAQRSRLLPIWRLAGWLTGALPALVGPRAVYATVEAVERFVDQHYGEQVEWLATVPELAALRQTLLACQGDEVAHRDEAAAARGPGTPGALMRVWCGLVDTGSRAAVVVCRHV